MGGDLSWEHWRVPVRGLTRADPDGVAHAIARRDGTVILDLICGDSRIMVRLDVSRAAQLSAGIWEAAGAAQQLIANPGADLPAPSRPSSALEDLPVAWRADSPENASSGSGVPRRGRRRPVPVHDSEAMDVMRTIGLRIRRIRVHRDKPLRVISGLAGMSITMLHRAEHGQCELTLSQIVALAGALQTTPWNLIRLPIFAPPDAHPGTTGEQRRPLPPEIDRGPR